jgi:hypothetical protein
MRKGNMVDNGRILNNLLFNDYDQYVGTSDQTINKAEGFKLEDEIEKHFETLSKDMKFKP